MTSGRRPPGFSYAKSADGSSIAWMRLGHGPSLMVVPPVPLSNISGDWSVPLMRDVFDRFAASFDLILYEGRGTGASQRSVDDFSPEAQAADIEAVMDAAQVDRAALLAIYLACPAALTFAARAPQRVSHLVLFGASETGYRSVDRPGTDALLGLIDQDWALFTKTAALDWMGWGAGDSGRLVAESFRTATTPEIAKAAISEYATTDLRPLLPDVASKTLVLHRRDGRQVPMEQSADLAGAVQNGRLHVLDGDSATLFFDDPSGTVDVITSFVQPELELPMRRSEAIGATESLTTREQEVLRAVAAGGSNAEIAHDLGISVHTVERHVANIYRKIDARGRADATAWTLRNGLG